MMLASKQYTMCLWHCGQNQESLLDISCPEGGPTKSHKAIIRDATYRMMDLEPWRPAIILPVLTKMDPNKYYMLQVLCYIWYTETIGTVLRPDVYQICNAITAHISLFMPFPPITETLETVLSPDVKTAILNSYHTLE